MKLKVLGSSSAGNCYVLESENDSLIVEAGVHFDEVKHAFKFDFSKVSGVLITHEHGDHSKSVQKFIDSGIDVFCSFGTASKFKPSHRIKILEAGKEAVVGSYTVLPFDVVHDAEEPLGFLINHVEAGNILFLTDSQYSPFTFAGLNQIIIEANFSEKILLSRAQQGSVSPFLMNRIYRSHFSFENMLECLKANDLTAVENIVLIHLSDGNSNAEVFRQETEDLTGKKVFIAEKGLQIDFNLKPY